jgi:hypothetical protein
MKKSLEIIRSNNSEFKLTEISLEADWDQVFEENVDPFSHDLLWITEPQKMNARLDRQGGSFLLSGNWAKRIETVLGLEIYKGVDVIKFVIDHRLFTQVFALLRKMNITSKSLFGDLQGLAKGLRMEMQVYAAE